MINVSIFKDFVNVVKHVPIADVLGSIKTCFYAKQIDRMREVLAAGDQKEYDRLKKLMPSMTPAGTFRDIRRQPFLDVYSHYVPLDIDKLDLDTVQRIKKIIILCRYTLACFVSPSGKGLKILVAVNTGPEQHLNAFLSVQQFYSALTGVTIDASGKDITRLCFLSADAELYYNPDAMVYDPLSGAGQSWPAVVPKAPVKKPAKPVDTDKIYRRAIAYVERYHKFLEGQRNNYNYMLSLTLRREGFSEATTLGLLLRDYNYNEQEVRNCVKNTYGYNLTEKLKGEKVTKLPTEKVIPRAEAPPDDPPSRAKKQTGRDLYDIREVEISLKKWFETRYNVVIGVIEWRIAGSGDPFVWMEDKHEHSMFCKLHRDEQMIPMSTLHILLHSDFSPDYDPYVDYFEQLDSWDGETDYITQLCDTVKTTDAVYWYTTFLKWFVAFVASMINNECINHTVVVLVGAQGVGKTRWMKRLMPEVLQDFLGTTTMQIDSKDATIQLGECGLIILDEMEGHNRKDLAAFKEMITRSKSRIRRPYGRNFECIPHRASFIAGVNHEQILTDLSGTRRYLCSNVTDIDHLHNVDIDGCMAQAYALFQSGFRYWFNQDEIKELTRHNEVFVSYTVEEELISIWFAHVTREEWNNRYKFNDSKSYLLLTTTQVATVIMEKARFTLLDTTVVKIGRILKKMGYERMRKKNNYAYMLRLLTNETVEKASHELEETAQQIAEQEDNARIIRFEEDLFNTSKDDDLPF